MTLSWSPKDILAICYNEANCEALNTTGYSAMLMPDKNDNEFVPKAGHYVVVTSGDALATAKDLLAGALCKPFEISYANLDGYQNLSRALAQGGPDLVRQIIGKSRSIYHDEVHPFIDVVKPDRVPSWNTAFSFLDPYLRWSESEFVCMAGPYAGGKSILAQILAYDYADVAGRQQGATASICAWEDMGWRIRRNIERFAVTREDLRPMKGPGARTIDLLKRVHRITCQPGVERSIDWYLERCEVLIKRDNCRFFVFDPAR